MVAKPLHEFKKWLILKFARFWSCYFTICNIVWKCTKSDRGVWTRASDSPWIPLNFNIASYLRAFPTVYIKPIALIHVVIKPDFSFSLSLLLFFCRSVVASARLRTTWYSESTKLHLPTPTTGLQLKQRSSPQPCQCPIHAHNDFLSPSLPILLEIQLSSTPATSPFPILHESQWQFSDITVPVMCSLWAATGVTFAVTLLT